MKACEILSTYPMAGHIETTYRYAALMIYSTQLLLRAQGCVCYAAVCVSEKMIAKNEIELAHNNDTNDDVDNRIDDKDNPIY